MRDPLLNPIDYPVIVFIGSESVESKKHHGSCNNCTHHDRQRYHIALVLPIGYLTGRTKTAKESMRIHFLTIAARSCDGSDHSLILTCRQLVSHVLLMGLWEALPTIELQHSGRGGLTMTVNPQ